MDYFPRDVLIVIDESHQTIPQIRGMYHGDRSRKETLVNYGFRLPSALDNRPLNFGEFEERLGQVIFASATPAAAQLEKTEGVVVEIVETSSPFSTKTTFAPLPKPLPETAMTNR